MISCVIQQQCSAARFGPVGATGDGGANGRHLVGHADFRVRSAQREHGGAGCARHHAPVVGCGGCISEEELVYGLIAVQRDRRVCCEVECIKISDVVGGGG